MPKHQFCRWTTTSPIASFAPPNLADDPPPGTTPYKACRTQGLAEKQAGAEAVAKADPSSRV